MSAALEIRLHQSPVTVQQQQAAGSMWIASSRMALRACHNFLNERSGLASLRLWCVWGCGLLHASARRGKPLHNGSHPPCWCRCIDWLHVAPLFLHTLTHILRHRDILSFFFFFPWCSVSLLLLPAAHAAWHGSGSQWTPGYPDRGPRWDLTAHLQPHQSHRRFEQ